MTTYTVTVTRDEDLWVAIIDGLPTSVIGTADYPSFEQLHADVPALIADLADRDPGDLDITWRYQFFGQDVTSEVLALMTATDQLDRARRQRDDAVRAALVALRGAGLSQQVIGDTVGLSKQRIHQILHESDLAQSA